jgi:capsular exopolysaccharide synthesis family protein
MSVPDVYRGSEIAVRPQTPLDFEGGAGAASDRLDLRSLTSILRRRILLIASIVGVCTLLAVIITKNSPKQYTANADVVLRTDTSEITPGPTSSDSNQPARSEAIETELQFVESYDLAGKVFDDLKLRNDAQFVSLLSQQGFIGSMLRRLGIGSAPSKGADPVQIAALREEAINRLVAQLQAKRIGTAYALRISYTDINPARAARIANGYARMFSEVQVAMKVEENQKAIGILRSRMEDLRRQAQADFGAVQQYRIRNNLQSKSGTALTEQEVSAYNQQVALARAEAAQDQARLSTALAQVRSGAGSGEATSPVVSALRSQRASISAKVAELSNRYLPSHPDLIAAREQLNDIDRQIAQEVQRSVLALDAAARASASKLASLAGSLGNATGTLAANNSALVALDDLDRRAQSSQELYESYLNRYKEAVARSGAEQPSSAILSAASVPKMPSSPNLVLNVALGLLVGVLLGSTAAITAESAYSGLTTPDDVERRLGVRCLGSVPLLESVQATTGDPVETIASYPGGVFAESMRGLRSATRQANGDRNQVLAITSALPGEGKTTLSACLARTVAMTGERVAVVDCDVVLRHLSAIFVQDEGHPGLQEHFAGRATLNDIAITEELSGAILFPITSSFPKGVRLLEQGRLNRFVAQLREQFDLIILDCAPILPIAETREIVALADNVIVVAKWRHTTDRAVRAALKLLPSRIRGNVGIVLNTVDMRKRIRFGDGDPGMFYKKYKHYYDA